MAKGRKTRPKLTPRRLPRTSSARATVDAVLDATAEHLVRSGTAGLRGAAIVERAGVGVGSLYEYFPSVASVVVAVAERELLLVERDTNRRLLHSAAPADALAHAFLARASDAVILTRALGQAAGTWGIGPRVLQAAAAFGVRLGETLGVPEERGQLAVEVVRSATTWTTLYRPELLEDAAWRARLAALASAALCAD
jgi:AcrR family transcriptional regulator